MKHILWIFALVLLAGCAVQLASVKLNWTPDSSSRIYQTEHVRSILEAENLECSDIEQSQFFSCFGEDTKSIQTVLVEFSDDEFTLSFPYESGFILGLGKATFKDEFIKDFQEILKKLDSNGSTSVQLVDFRGEQKAAIDGSVFSRNYLTDQ